MRVQKQTNSIDSQPIYLGIEGGGTRTRVQAQSIDGTLVADLTLGPANLRLLKDAALVRLLRSVAVAVPEPSSIAIGLAGLRTSEDRERVERAIARVWPDVPVLATNDLETALAAGEDSRLESASAGRVLILSGTGSCCFGRSVNGQTAKVGGWGHLLGDKGSGYEIGLRALKAVVYYLDRDGEWSLLGRKILRSLQFNEPNDLIAWAQAASKAEIAAIAIEVFGAWEERDAIASDILRGAAESLARDAVDCAKRLVARNLPVQFVLAGSVLTRQPRFGAAVGRAVKAQWPRATLTMLTKESVSGAVTLARRLVGKVVAPVPSERRRLTLSAPSLRPSRPGAVASTELRNPRSMQLDRMPIPAMIDLMVQEERWVARAVAAEKSQIARVIRWIVRAFRSGGRLFYVGAGTSGRLGVLDASECPPTFRTPPEWVQGIIAGGQRALWEAAEGAEDVETAGARAIEFRASVQKDVVVGIAASGRTPFVWGALRAARDRGARTVLLCCNPRLRIPRRERPDAVIALPVGPEILTGSTRLKAGTATKLVLNCFTTIAMVRLGKVRSNLMIDVKATNEKLRERAVRITRDLTGASDGDIRAALQRSDWQIPNACRLLRALGAH